MTVFGWCAVCSFKIILKSVSPKNYGFQRMNSSKLSTVDYISKCYNYMKRGILHWSTITYSNRFMNKNELYQNNTISWMSWPLLEELEDKPYRSWSTKSHSIWDTEEMWLQGVDLICHENIPRYHIYQSISHHTTMASRTQPHESSNFSVQPC